MRAALECRILTPELAKVVESFFQRLVDSGVDKYFHPHPFTADEALRRTSYSGLDIYYALMEHGRMVGYGILRGWDEGYTVPSLGIAIDPAAQGKGYGRFLMDVLHAAARHRGAKVVRLKVYPTNSRAIDLYKSLGYVFAGEQAGQLVGTIELEQ